MVDWAKTALEVMKSEAYALISLLACEGSTPRETGTRMMVTKDRIYGTIGGGNLEFQVIDQARIALKHPAGTWRIQDYPLGVLLGQCCGGRVRVMIEHFDPTNTQWIEKARDLGSFTLKTTLFVDRVERDISAGSWPYITARGAIPVAGEVFFERIDQPRTPLMMFGAGHVGLAIANLIKDLPFQLAWYDDREDVPEAVTVGDAEALCEQAEAATGMVLILTHDHALDYELTKAALRSKASFIGLIGSATKRARFISRLKKEGVSEAQIARITCPIGLAGLSGKAPAVIAVSVAAQLLIEAQTLGVGGKTHDFKGGLRVDSGPNPALFEPILSERG